jgi:hypothetical protein
MFLFTIKRGIFIALMCVSILHAVPEIVINWHDDPANITALFRQRENDPLVPYHLTLSTDGRFFNVVYPWEDGTRQLEIYRIATRERILSVHIRRGFVLSIRPVAQATCIALTLSLHPDSIVHTETILPHPVDQVVIVDAHTYNIRRTYTFV